MTATKAEEAPRRRGRPGYDLESVLQVAVEVFNERGYDGTSMEDLSKRLGIAKSAIYHHVSGKEELLRMALDRALDGWSEAAERAGSLMRRPSCGWRCSSARRWPCWKRGILTWPCCCACGATARSSGRRWRGERWFDGLVASLVAEAERDGDVRADATRRSLRGCCPG